MTEELSVCGRNLPVKREVNGCGLENIITEDKLKLTLFGLKYMLEEIELFPVKNILYFDIESYYLYLERYYNGRIKLYKIMKTLEPYIPLMLCMDNKTYAILCDAATSRDPKRVNKLKRDFYKI